MLLEAKARAIYFGAKEIGERIGPKTVLQIRKGVTLESVQRSEATKGFNELASDYYSVFRIESDPERQARALIELAQQLINEGSFGQARREFLPKISVIARELQGHPFSTIKARCEEKLAWIADYQFGYPAELMHLSKSREYLGHIPKDLWEDEHKKTEGTLDHFTGRAYYGLATQGINPRESVQNSIRFFYLDLQRAEKLRESGTPDSANESFQHLRLTFCYILLGEFLHASTHLERASILADEKEEGPGKKGLEAHICLAKATFLLKQGNIGFARQEFNKAIEIRRAISPYRKGLSDALLGLASVNLIEGKLVEAGKNLREAISVYPLTAVWLISGGFAIRQ